MMKKTTMFLAVAMVLVFTGVAMAEVNWHVANQSTVGWDAVTQLDNGDPLPAGSTVQYVVLVANAITDPNKTNPVEVGTVSNLEHTITLNIEGKYYVGVKALRIVDGAIVSESVIAWSDNPESVKDGQTFGLSYFRPLKAVGGLGPKEL